MNKFETTYDKDEKIWRGLQTLPIFNENLSAGEVALFMMRSKNPQDVMQISDSEGTTLTYGSALTSAIRIAQHFKRLQLTADDFVGIFATSTTYTMPVAVAAWLNGTPFQPISYNHETSVVKTSFESTRPKIIFCDGLHYEKLKNATQSFKPLIYTLCNHLEYVSKVEELLEPTATENVYQAEPLKYGPDQVMAIMMSSGTTGLPKGICLSNAYCCAEFGLTNGSSIIFSTSSIDWITGLICLIMNVLVGGIRIITTRNITPEYQLEIITKHKISYLISPPRTMSQMSLLPTYNKEAMQSMQLLLMGGAKCSETTMKRIRSALTNGHMAYTYGSTEISFIASNASDYKSMSVGKLALNIKLKIVDPNTGEILGPNQAGEIYLASRQKFLGYYKNPESTKNSMDDEGFFRTGDLGYMDDELYLHLVDRCKDIMKFQGYQYSPQEIEEIIAEIPDVVDACVFGVFDEIRLDVPAAAVVRKEGSWITESDIINYVESKTEVAHKRIHYGVFFVNELPRNTNGKLLRIKIKEMCLAMEKANKQKTDG